MRQTAAFLLLIAVALLGAVGCAGGNRYHIMDRMAEQERIPMRVVVTDLDDERTTGNSYNSGFANIPLVGWWGGYTHSRHDEIYTGSVEPFPSLLAKDLAARLNEVGVFESVQYAAPGKLPPEGEYDLLIKGQINELEARGAVIKYGLWRFADWVWYLGFPNLSRRWIIDVQYELVNAYTDDLMLPVDEYKDKTGHAYFTRYYSRAKITDLRKDISPLYDSFIDQVWEKAPAGTDSSWAKLRSEGLNLLAARKAEEEQARKGSPPAFEFLAPLDGSDVRTAKATVRFRIDAPGRLKSAAFAVNNQPVDLGIDVLSLANAETAPRTIPPREIEVPLKLGDNKLEAIVSDHRGNEPQRSSIDVVRLPAELRPVERYALLIDATGGESSVDDLKGVLVDPLLGQFKESDVTELKMTSLDAAALQQAMMSFGRTPLAGNLALVYLHAKGDWTNLTVGDGLSLDQFLKDLDGALATDQVVLLLDIDWSGGPGDDKVDARLENLPPRWAVMFSDAVGGAVPGAALAQSATRVIRGTDERRPRLPLQRFLDDIRADLVSREGTKPDVFGRYDTGVVMVERE